MELVSEIFSFLSIVFNTYIFVKVYALGSKKKIKVNCTYALVIFLASLSTYFVNALLPPVYRMIISSSTTFLMFYVIFKENIFVTLFKFVIIILLLSLCDIIPTIAYIFLKFDSSIIVNINFFRALNTILVSLILYLLFLIKPIRNLFNKLYRHFSNKWSFVILGIAVCSCLFFLLITHLSALVLDIEIFISSIFIILFVLCLCIIMIYQYFKNKHAEEEQNHLLELMTDYEKMLDKDKENRHEMLNNLLTLRSFDNKASKEYEDMLDDIIMKYDDKKSNIYSSMSNLPSGLKGIIYYKQSLIKDNNIDLTLVYSNKIGTRFEELNSKLYYKACKILGILLDNAIEASCLTEDKHLLIDIYLENKNLVIYIENSFIDSVDLNNIYNKGVSSKGNNRGYGLYLVKKIVNETDEIKFEQEINNKYFVTVLKIKSPR